MVPTVFVIFLALLALSIPVAVAIGLASMAGVKFFTNMPMLVTAQQLFVSIDKFPLVAIPFFILAGNLMEAGGISERLVQFARAVVGGVQGGLAMSCVITCMIFAAVSGSSVATTFAIGAIIIPAMVQRGYPVQKSAALQATSAELGVIIPPSIPMILYGVAAEVSIGELFIAGFGPGLVIAGGLILAIYIWCKITGHGQRDGEGRLALSVAFSKASLALLMPVIVLGGIYGGVFTPTEASVVAVFYALILGMFIYRRISPTELWRCLQRTVVSTTVIMLIIAAAGLFAFLITRAGVPAAVGTWVAANLDGPVAFLIGVNVFLFLVGMFIETGAAIVVLAPILVPVAQQFGVDPVHFGIIMVVNLALGMITPPFGVNLFAACTVAKISYDAIVPAVLPFVAVVTCSLAIITFVPELSLWLRDLVYR
jgi:tripartite ATP-independent transporter DctM subunit